MGAYSSLRRRKARAGSRRSRFIQAAALESLEVRRLLNAAIVVDTTADEIDAGGTTSLREALNQAAMQAGDDVIVFDPAVFSAGSLHTITPLGEPLLIKDATGKVTVSGPGRDVLAISGNQAGRSFDVEGTSDALITGMTMKDGTGAGLGGGVRNLATLALDDVLLTNNQIIGDTPTFDPTATIGASGGEAIGGAIYNTGTLSITNSTLSNNLAKGGNGGNGSVTGGAGGDARGGAIFTSGGLTLTDCTFSGNVASAGGGGAGTGTGSGGIGGTASGGALYATDTASLAIHDSAFSENHANLTDDATGGSSDSGNAGSGGAAAGGAIYSEFGPNTLSIDGVSLFSNNEAFGGVGGSGSTASGGGGSALGGAIYSGRALTADGTNFGSNFARGGTGGIATALSSTSGGGGGFASGGAIYTPHVNVSLTDPFFILNTARGGNGGPAAGPGHNGGPGAGAAGGAIYSHGDVTILSNNPQAIGFEFNSGQGGNGGLGEKGGDGGLGDGGAVFIDDDGSLLVTGEGFSQNTITSGAAGSSSTGAIASSGLASGGALFSQGPLHVHTSFFDGNQAVGADGATQGGEAAGGAILNQGSLDLADSSLTNNSALGGSSSAGDAGGASGGAIAGPGSLQMLNSTLDHNSARAGDAGSGATGHNGSLARGGGLVASAATTISNSTISNNVVTGGNGGNGSAGAGGVGGSAIGGGLFLQGNATVTNSTIVNNLAQGGAGGAGSAGESGGDGRDASAGGAYIEHMSTVSLINVTIAGNTATGGAGGAAGPGGAAGAAGTSSGGGLVDVISETITNVIVANNTADTSPDIFGNFLAKNSLIEDSTGASFVTGSANNITGQAPKLGVLTDNGGPTKTMLPAGDSPVIDAGDNTAALAQFGAGGFDQRGPGFPRFVGTVDIGAVELGPPMIEVAGNGHVIADEDTTPSTTDFTNFGLQFRYAQPLQRTFVVTNTGDKTLQLGPVKPPLGYTVIDPLVTSLEKGQSDSFTLQLSTQNPGTFTGDVMIETNDPATGTFTFRITGTISPTFKINYQPAAAPVPDGYVADAGLVFGNRGNGLSYGWNQSAASFTRDRNVLSDQARDTLVHMQLFGSRIWEVSVPNGAYQVHLVSGDPSFFDSVYKVNVEGVLVVNGTPTNGKRFVEGTQTVIVTDGKLTVSNATGASNNKLDFIDVTPVSTPPVRINFQTTTSPTPGGFLADAGLVFGNRGNGQSYGWNLSATAFARDRNNLNSPDQQHDTLIHTQLYGARVWELAVPNGTYMVHLVAGDPNFIDSVYKYNVEGVLTVNGTPTAGNHFVEGTKTVSVSDGRLTVTNAAGSVNNKIDFIEVTPIIV